MQQTLYDHNISISISGIPVFNLHFTDDIDPMADSNNKLQDLSTKHLLKEQVYMEWYNNFVPPMACIHPWSIV